MEAMQILEYDAKHNQKMPFSAVVDIISKEINEEHAQIVREGNTLFIMKTLPNGVCEFHSFNADPKENFIKNVIAFLKLLERLRYSSAITPFANPALEHIAKKYLSDKFDIEVHKTGDEYVLEVTF